MWVVSFSHFAVFYSTFIKYTVRWLQVREEKPAKTHSTILHLRDITGKFLSSILYDILLLIAHIVRKCEMHSAKVSTINIRYLFSYETHEKINYCTVPILRSCNANMKVFILAALKMIHICFSYVVRRKVPKILTLSVLLASILQIIDINKATFFNTRWNPMIIKPIRINFYLNY